MSEDLISREKAYEVLSEYYHHKTEVQHKALREALDMVPSAELQPTCNQLATSCNQLATDCISRQAAIEALRRAEALTKAFGYHNVIETIRDLPSADIDLSDYSDRLWRNAYEQGKADAEAEPKKGQWIPGKELSREMLAGQVVNIEYENYRCSACGIPIDRLLYHVDGSPFYKFCPNCGADMRGEEK